MQQKSCLFAVFFIALVFWGCQKEAPVSPPLSSAVSSSAPVSVAASSAVKAALFSGDMTTSVTKTKEHGEITSFQAAGPAGARGLLTEGDTFPPTGGASSKLRREGDQLRYDIWTNGLPPGAYTNWWVIVNDPSQCGVPNECTLDDVFTVPATRSTAFWATGSIVPSDGKGHFQAEIREGQPAKGPDGFLFGNGLEDARNAFVFLIIKYHGPASNDPDELSLQINTLLGLCDDRANALPNGQCFDPQIVTHDGDGIDDESNEVSRADLFAFQAAGSLGGGVLTPGTSFPPVNGTSKLFAGTDWLSYQIHTDGLPPGAYTNWWVIVNNPEECEGPCDLDDIFGNPATNSSVFWATGAIVGDDGVGDFHARIGEGEPSKGPDGFLLGNGLQDAEKAEVHLIVKYHGPASDDPAVLFDQTHTLLGSCDQGANGTDEGQCFDPQAVVHRRSASPDIAASDRLFFGPVAVGTSKDETFELSNEGTADLTIDKKQLAGSSAGEYTVMDLDTPVTLAPGESRDVTVRFTPTSSGVKKGQVRLFSNDPDENPLPLAFTGTGTGGPVPVPDIAASPTKISFGSVAVGASKEKTFILTNEGAADLVIDNKQLAGSSAGQYAVLDLDTPATIAPGKSRRVTVRFTPASSGTKKGQVKLFSNDPDENPFPVAFTGTGM